MQSGNEIELSVVIPVFNERENLSRLCREAIRVLDGLEKRYELLIIDDGSTDGSCDTLRAEKNDFPALRLIRLSTRQGQSAALAAGFRSARGRLIITMDGDLQTDPADIPRLLAHIDEYDLVIGYRYPRRDPLWKKFQAALANRIRSLILGDSIRDIGCPLRVIRKSDLAEIPIFDGFHRFIPILLEANGRSVGQVRVRHRPRLEGRSKYGMMNRVFRTFIDAWCVKWLIRRKIGNEGEEIK